MKVMKFWMVWNPNGCQPKCKHNSKASAVQEANRLAKLSPGQRFFVLKAITGFKADTPAVEEIKLVKNDIPF